VYIIAGGFQKMYRRIDDEYFSKPFYDCLTGIRHMDVATRQFPTPQAIDSFLGGRDAALIEILSQELVESFLKLSEIGIPKLLTLAKSYKSGSPLPPFYTEET
jgi:hypothetical protein